MRQSALPTLMHKADGSSLHVTLFLSSLLIVAKLKSADLPVSLISSLDEIRKPHTCGFDHCAQGTQKGGEQSAALHTSVGKADQCEAGGEAVGTED